MLQTQRAIDFIAAKFPSGDPEIASLRANIDNVSRALRLSDQLHSTHSMALKCDLSMQPNRTLMDSLGDLSRFGDFGSRVAPSEHKVEQPEIAQALVVLEQTRELMSERIRESTQALSQEKQKLAEAKEKVDPASASEILTEIKTFASSAEGRAFIKKLKEKNTALILEPAISVDGKLLALGLTGSGFRIFNNLDGKENFEMAGWIQRFRIGNFCEKLANLSLGKAYISGFLGLCLSEV